MLGKPLLLLILTVFSSVHATALGIIQDEVIHYGRDVGTTKLGIQAHMGYSFSTDSYVVTPDEYQLAGGLSWGIGILANHKIHKKVIVQIEATYAKLGISIQDVMAEDEQTYNLDTAMRYAQLALPVHLAIDDQVFFVVGGYINKPLSASMTGLTYNEEENAYYTGTYQYTDDDMKEINFNYGALVGTTILLTQDAFIAARYTRDLKPAIVDQEIILQNAYVSFGIIF